MADMSRRRSMNGASVTDSRKRKFEEMTENGDAEDENSSSDYPCHYCSAVFVTQISLNRHVLTFHDGEGRTEVSVKEELTEEDDQGSQEDALEERSPSNDYYYQFDDDDGNGQEEGYMYDADQMDGNEDGELIDIAQFMQSSTTEGDDLLDYSQLMSNEQPTTQNRMSKRVSVPVHPPEVQKTAKPKLSPEVLANVLAQVEELTSSTTSEFVTCPLCRKTFGRKELSIHVSCEHGGAKFTCPYCARTISRRDHLKRHIQNVHPEMCNENEIGPFPRNLNLCRANNSHQQKKPSSVSNGNQNSNGPSVNVNHVSQLMGHTLAMEREHHQQSFSKTLPISIMTPRVQVGGDDEDDEDSFEGEELHPQAHFNGNGSSIVKEEEEEDSMQITVEPELPFQDLNDYAEEDYSNHDFNFVDSLLQFGHQKQVPGNAAAISAIQRAQVTIDNMAYQCSLCNAVFSSKTLLDRHESTHSELRPHKCSLCGKGFLRKEHLSKHLSSVHSGMKFTCEFCGKDISRKDHLIRHIRNVHPNQFYSMPIDGEQSQPENIVDLALKAVQSLQPRPKKPFFNCDMCEATFVNIDDLHIHQSTVHSDVRKYKCNYCAKAFKRKEHLTKHEVLHTGERKFTCRVCGSEFQRKETLQDHIKKIHGINSNNVTVNGSNGTAISTIPCNLCDQLFQDRGMLLSHMTTAHGLIVNSPPGLPKNSQQQQLPPPSSIQQQRQSTGQSKPSKSGSSQKNMPPLNGSNLGSLMDLINKGSITLSFHPIKQE